MLKGLLRLSVVAVLVLSAQIVPGSAARNGKAGRRGSKRVGGGYATTAESRKGQGTPAKPHSSTEVTIEGGGTKTANNGQAQKRRMAGGKIAIQNPVTCDPPQSVLVGDHCEYHCHETALPSNDTRHTCVCGPHHEPDGVDDSGLVVCKKAGSSQMFDCLVARTVQ